MLLAVEWPWLIHTLQAESLRLSFDGKVYEAVHTDLVPDLGDTPGAFRFTVKSGAWAVEYEAVVDNSVLRYRCITGREVTVIRPRSEVPLSDWLNANGLLFIMDGDRIIEHDLIFKPTWDKPPFDRGQLTVLAWAGTNLKVESQTKDKLTDSIQYRAIVELKKQHWDVMIDDDRAGEIADIVALRIEGDHLLVRLVHCKYSHEDFPGARVADLYEVCGQAQKSIMWRRSDLGPFFKTLHDRARKKYQREGVSPFEIGDYRTLYELQEKATVLRRKVEMVVVQPGLSVAAASTQQLNLLASTQAYLRTTINAPLAVWCSA